jgi:hypothetical protein
LDKVDGAGFDEVESGGADRELVGEVPFLDAEGFAECADGGDLPGERGGVDFEGGGDELGGAFGELGFALLPVGQVRGGQPGAVGDVLEGEALRESDGSDGGAVAASSGLWWHAVHLPGK